ncbi:hypothetical protein CEXT_614371 [Caerostris extrusa]|uniref:Uncharacterized protein n=1 Tax=Caerostris extrusa TaxID=172846 RepID=A0AAV4RKN0_CAEEX|nr:hypothetical protein CEXT_614371 [Caerostris extrusa]
MARVQNQPCHKPRPSLSATSVSLRSDEFITLTIPTKRFGPWNYFLILQWGLSSFRNALFPPYLGASDTEGWGRGREGSKGVWAIVDKRTYNAIELSRPHNTFD